MTLGLLLIVVLPLSFAIGSIVVNSDRIMQLVAAVPNFHVPSAPDWLADVPIVGGPALEQWAKIADRGVSDFVELATPYVGTITRWFVGAAGSVGHAVRASAPDHRARRRPLRVRREGGGLVHRLRPPPGRPARRADRRAGRHGDPQRRPRRRRHRHRPVRGRGPGPPARRRAAARHSERGDPAALRGPARPRARAGAGHHLAVRRPARSCPASCWPSSP